MNLHPAVSPAESRMDGVDRQGDPLEKYRPLKVSQLKNLKQMPPNQWIFQVPVKGGRDYITPKRRQGL